MSGKLNRHDARIVELLANLELGVFEAETSPNRGEKLRALADTYNEHFDGEIKKGRMMLGRGTLRMSLADGGVHEEQDRVIYGSFEGFEIENFFGREYLAIAVTPENADFPPDDEDEEEGDQVVASSLLVSAEYQLGYDMLILDPEIEAIDLEIDKWKKLIELSHNRFDKVFSNLNMALNRVYFTYCDSIKNRGKELSDIEIGQKAINELMLYDAPALESAISVMLNPQNDNRLTVESEGSLVSKYSDNRFLNMSKLETVTSPTRYHGTFKGISIQSTFQKDSSGNILGVYPRAYVVMNEDQEDALVAIPFVFVNALHFGTSETQNSTIGHGLTLSPELFRKMMGEDTES